MTTYYLGGLGLLEPVRDSMSYAYVNGEGGYVTGGFPNIWALAELRLFLWRCLHIVLSEQ